MKIEEIPLVIAFDQNYLVPACVMLTSLCENAVSDTVYRVFIIADEETRRSSASKIEETVAPYRRHAVEWLDPADHFVGAKTRHHLSRPNYYRFLIPEFLPQYDKAIWLDVDMIVKRDLRELFSTDLAGNYIGAVRIGLHNAGVQHVPWDSYFNAGLLLMNLALWRKDDVAGQARRLIAENDFSCPTQDPMNLIGYGKTVFLPVEYNVYLSPKSMKGRRKRDYLRFHHYGSFGELVAKAAILHFVENLKPWNYEAYPEREEWLRYFRMSAAKETELHFVQRPSPVRKWLIKIVSMFIFNKQKRRKFREKIWGKQGGVLAG